MGNTIANSLITLIFVLCSVRALGQEQVSSTPRPPRLSKTKHFAHIGPAVWGANIVLITSDNRSENIQIEYAGYTFGYEYIYRLNRNMAWVNGAELLLLSGQARSEGQSINYQQKVNATPVLGWSGIRYSPKPEVMISGYLGAAYNSLKLAAPSTSIVASYDFKYPSVWQLVAKFQLGWMLTPKILLQQEIFSTTKAGDPAGWGLSVGYFF